MDLGEEELLCSSVSFPKFVHICHFIIHKNLFLLNLSICFAIWMKQFEILENVIHKQKHFPKIKLLTRDFINCKK